LYALNEAAIRPHQRSNYCDFTPRKKSRFDIDQRRPVANVRKAQPEQRAKMRFVKMIFVLAVSVSVAVLPAAAGFSVGAPSSAAAQSMAMSDCDHHMHKPAGETEKSDSDCISMAACVLHCFSFTGVAAAALAFVPVVGGTLQPMNLSAHLSPQTGSLPFRPPRA